MGCEKCPFIIFCAAKIIESDDRVKELETNQLAMEVDYTILRGLLDITIETINDVAKEVEVEKLQDSLISLSESILSPKSIETDTTNYRDLTSWLIASHKKLSEFYSGLIVNTLLACNCFGPISSTDTDSGNKKMLRCNVNNYPKVL
jgi:hypothetical protein